MLVVKSKIKDVAQMNVAGDFAEALNKEIEAIVQKACKRAQDNGRATLMAKDL